MSVLDVQRQGGVITLIMNRPEARNALNEEMKQAFAAAVPALASDPEVRAVILAGAGGVFCAGGDIRGMAEARQGMTIEGWRERMRELQPWMRQLLELDKPLIAAVDGVAYGAGFSLALMADFVLASPRARFCLSFMRVGLVPDFAAMYTLPRVVGVQRAKELMLSAREVSAEEALKLGIAMELLPSEQLMARADALARSFIGASPLAVSLIKRDARAAFTTELPAALANEADHQAMCFSTSYQAEAVQRFLDKQPARFQWPAVKG
ncbi:MAG: enoyl-CoA hydratase/isomerase family protein [Burkholderiales bacterium]|nr:enoyl-CoA hydratase/isomerase family protein [Burkholderiales bacterium]